MSTNFNYNGTGDDYTVWDSTFPFLGGHRRIVAKEKEKEEDDEQGYVRIISCTCLKLTRHPLWKREN